MSDWWANDPIAGGNAAPSSRPRITISPVQQSFLNSVAAGESPDYNTMYGGGRFEELNDHPRQNIPIASGPNAGKTSSAAGRYQFLQGTWDEAKQTLGLPDFSPESQDAAAVWLAERDYKARTKGRDLWSDLEGAKDNPAKLNFVAGALGKTWTSLPGGAEPNGATSGFGQRMSQEFSAQARRPQQEDNWWANDPVAGGQQADVPLPPSRPAEATSATFNDRFAGMDVTPAMRTSIEAQNQQIAGGQGTTPQVDLQRKNFISDIVHENDAGMAVFRDPKTGQMVEAQDNKHVVLRDPQDNRLKVFARSDETNENPMVSASRVLAAGLASGAPTARAAIPVANATKQAAAPSREALLQAANQGYKQARELGVRYDPAAVGDMAFRTQGALIESGFNEITAPNTYKLLGKFGNAADDAPAGAGATFNDLESVRKGLGRIAQGHSSPDAIVRSDASAASRAIDSLDEFFTSGNGVVAGDGAMLAEISKDARGNFAAAKRSERVGRAEELAELQAASGGSGANIDNAMRQRIKDILKSPKEKKGFSDEEIVQMRKIVHGTFAGNTARLVGKLAPTGVVSATMSGGSGFAFLGPAGAVGVPVVGFAAKKLSDVMTGSQLAKLDNLIRSRSPLAKQIESSLTDWSSKANALADVPNAPKVAQFALASRNLVNNLKDAGITMSPSDFMKALQGPMRSSAEDE